MAIEFKKADEPKISTAVRKDVQRPTEAAHVASEADRNPGEVGGRTRALPVGTQASPVDPNRKRGRPSTNFDKKAYQREYMRRRRAKAKAEKILP